VFFNTIPTVLTSDYETFERYCWTKKARVKDFSGIMLSQRNASKGNTCVRNSEQSEKRMVGKDFWTLYILIS